MKCFDVVGLGSYARQRVSSPAGHVQSVWLIMFLIACEFSVRSSTKWHMPFRWVTCVDDEAAHCNNVRPHSTLGPKYSADGRGHASGVVIDNVHFCHQNSSEPPLTQRDVVFTYPKLEPTAALGRSYNLRARYMFAYTFRLFLLTTTYCAPPMRAGSRTTLSTYHTDTSLRVLQSRSQLVASIASVKGVVRACPNRFLNPSVWGQLRAQCPTLPLAVVPRGRLRRPKSDLATAPGSCQTATQRKILLFQIKKATHSASLLLHPLCFMMTPDHPIHSRPKWSDMRKER